MLFSSEKLNKKVIIIQDYVNYDSFTKMIEKALKYNVKRNC